MKRRNPPRLAVLFGLVLSLIAFVLGALRADRPWKRLQADYLDAPRQAENPGWISWRHVPGLRDLDPQIGLVEVRPPGLGRLANHGREPRVDRCMTCHLGMEGDPAPSPAAAARQAPFAAHPHPELFVAEGSAHPRADFGCTVCHGGEGRSTDFSRAGHQPASDAEAAAWAERWDYSPVPGAEPILPPELVEARCAACHESALYLDVLARDSSSRAARGENLEHGRNLLRHLNCSGCHAAEPASPPPGPPLGRLAAKTTPEWTFFWIAAPRRFRPATAMPHLFPDDAASDPLQAARIRAMVKVLFSSFGGPGTLVPGRLPAPPEGTEDRGAELFTRLGCRACHLLDEASHRADAPLERLRGPQLARSGDKLDAAWLYAFLRRPRAHQPRSAMPDLRLSEEEAADLTAFLMAQSDPAWRDLDLPAVDPRARDGEVRRLLEAAGGPAATRRLSKMSEQEKEHFLGRESLVAFGCHGCHQIPEIEPLPPPAAPLSQAGQNAGPFLRRLAEGGPRAAVAHDPQRGPAPEYGLSDEEATALLTAVLARRDDPLTGDRLPERGPRAQAIAAGEKLLEQRGCLSCHRLGGHRPAGKGAVGAAFPDPAAAPPALDSAGRRLRSPWLAEFLHDPAANARRPWLAARMPTYDLAPGELDILTRFFAAWADVPLFVPPPPPATGAELAAGRAVARILDCNRCHAGTPEASELAEELRAPSYGGAAERLRPRFVVEWILDPQAVEPQTRMPASFKQGGGPPDTAFLAAMLEAPMFQNERRRLLTAFDSAAELEAFLTDTERVAAAVRAHLFTLEKRESPRP